MIYIFLRETTNWLDEDVFLAQLGDKFKPKVQRWNDTFNMPYHIFRYRIKNIAQVTLDNVKNAVCTEFEQIPEGSITVPIDDDDWLAPELGQVLEAEQDNIKTGYFWERNCIQPPASWFIKAARIAVYDIGRIKRKQLTCITNNYAMIKTDHRQTLLKNHVKASEYFDREPDKVRKIDANLSVMNRTLASQTSLAWLRPDIRRKELVRKYHQYRNLYGQIEWQELTWCQPYLTMMVDLMAELELKRPTYPGVGAPLAVDLIC